MKNILEKIKKTLERNKFLAFSFAFFALFSLSVSVFATPPSSPYNAGDTLDPSCAPGDTNCTVSILPSQTGNSGKFLTTDGTTASWGSTIASATFNNVTLDGTITLDDLQNAGAVLFTNSSGAVTQDTSNFVWDDSNDRLGIGTSSPNYTLDVDGGFSVSGDINLASSDTTFLLDGDGRIRFRKNGKTDAGGGDQFFFGDTEAWSTANSDADIGIANNFHAYWDGSGPHRVEFESGQGEMQFYIEGGDNKDAWYGLQEGATHHWSFGQDASIGGDFVINSGFGLNGSYPFRIDKQTNRVFIGENNPDEIHRSISTHRLALLSSDEDATLQIGADNTGSVGVGIILSTQQNSTDGRHWTIQHKGPTLNNRFSLSYVTSSADGQNLLTGGSEYFSISTSGNVGIGNTSPTGKLVLSSTSAQNFIMEDTDDSKAITQFSGSSGGGWIYTNDAPLRWFTASYADRNTTGSGWTEVMRLSNTGSLGINTSGPDRKLDVLDTSAAQLRLTYTDGSVYTDFQTDSSGYLNITPSGSRIKFGTQVTFIGTGSRAEFSTAGGANTNQFKFSTDSALTATSGAVNHIDTVASFTPTSGTATFTQFLVSHTINQTGGANGITRGIYINPTLTSAADYRALEIGNSSGYSIYQSGASATNYFAGSIGVGTTSPNQSGGAKALTIASTGSNAALEIWMNKDTITDDTTSGILSFIAGSSSPRRVAEIAAKVRGTNEDTADITFTTMNGGTVGEKMRLLANGNFGIGTDSPDTRLSVASSGANGIHLDIDAGNTSNSGRLFFENSSTTFSIFNSASLLTFGYGASPGGSSGNGALFINTSGKVGVGVSPRKKLDVLDSSDVQLRLTHTDNSVYTDFQTNSSGNLVISPTGGYVGIGTTPLHPLHITSSITQPNSSDVYSAYFKRTYTNNDASTGTRKFGLRVENTYAGTQAYTNASGINNEQAVTNTSTSSQYVGFNSLIEFSGSAAASSITGYSSNLKPLNTVTNAIGFDSFLVGAGTTTNAKLFNAYLSSNSGTITNTYGFYVGDITTGTQTNTPYSFYASDTAARNYFAGDTGFGSATSPSEYIHIKDIASNATPYIYIEGADGGNVGAGLYSTGGAGGAQAGFSLKWSRGSANDIDNNDTFGTYLTTTTNTNLFLGTAGRGRIKIDHDGDTTFFGTNGTTVSMFFDAGSGFLGIGDSSPDYKLDVEGDAPTSYIANFFNDGNDDNRYGIVIQAGADSPSAGRWIQFNDGDGGDVGTVSLVTGTLTLTTTSDERLKENIEDTEIGLDNLRAIQVRDFSFKADGTHRTVHGFIAQELYEAYPDAVITSEDPDKYWQVSYTHLTPLIVKSIQELDVTLSGIENLEEDSSFIANLREWLASATNGIARLFAKQVSTETLCIADEAGSETCITKSQLDSLLSNIGSSGTVIYSSGGSGGSSGGDSGDSGDSGSGDSDTGDSGDTDGDTSSGSEDGSSVDGSGDSGSGSGDSGSGDSGAGSGSDSSSGGDSGSGSSSGSSGGDSGSSSGSTGGSSTGGSSSSGSSSGSGSSAGGSSTGGSSSSGGDSGSSSGGSSSSSGGSSSGGDSGSSSGGEA